MHNERLPARLRQRYDSLLFLLGIQFHQSGMLIKSIIGIGAAATVAALQNV